MDTIGSSTQSCLHEDSIQPTEPITQPEEHPDQENFQLVNFSTKVEDKNVCFSCRTELDNVIPVCNSSAFGAILSFTEKTEGETFYNSNKNCSNCNTQLLYLYSNPIAVSNEVLDQDVNSIIDASSVSDVTQKVTELVNIYKLMAIHQQPENAVSIFHEYPHYFFFNIKTVGSTKFLHLSGYKKHLIGEPTIKSVRENATELYSHMIGSKPGTPAISSKRYLESLGTSFYGVDENYSKYKSLLFLDIDGTISKKSVQGCSGSLSTTLMRVLSRLEKLKLVKIVLNTGRPTIWGMLYMKDLGLDPLVIGNNGTGICYKKKSLDQTKPALILSNAPTAAPMVYLLDLLHVKYGLKFGVLTKSNTSCGQIIVSNIGIPSPSNLEKLINQDVELKLFLDQVGLGRITCTDDGGGFVNIRSCKYNKAITASKLITALNFPISNCFNIGNAENDVCLIELLKENSYGVANSDQVYAEKVPNLAKSKEARGVIQSIKEFLLKKELCTTEEFTQIINGVKEEVKLQSQFLFE